MQLLYPFDYCFTILICFCVCRIALSRDAPVVNIPDQGQIMGFFIKMFRTQTIVGYLGIPYAHPPIDDRRFAPPFVDTLPSWQGIRSGANAPMQCWSDVRKPIKNHDEIFFKILGIDPKNSNASQFSEDCLYLNIFVPDDPPPKDGYAVIVWLHSGDFVSGNSSELNPFQLVFKQKVIIVTVAFRLGVFGFFTTNDGEASGNYGLMDQSAALLWVNRNIQLFNGNPKSVTLMGHGAGAVSISLHLTSGEWSEDLFQKAIIMSGSSLSSTWVRDPRSYKSSISQVSDTFACSPQTSAMLRCLRRVDATLFMESIPPLDWTPVIDNRLSNTTTPFIPDDPKILFDRANAIRKVPVIIGFTDMEDVLDVSMREMLENGLSNDMYTTLTTDVVLNDIAQLEANNETYCGENGGGTNNQPILDAMEFAYKPYFTASNGADVLRKKYIDFSTERSYVAPSFSMAKALSKNSEVFMYRFDTKPKTQSIVDLLPTWSGVPHRFDQIFVWGMPYWVSLENQTLWYAEDKRLSDIIMTMWANFAKYSNPTEIGVYIRWDNFTETDPGVLLIDRSFNMSDSSSFNYQGVQFWNDYYPKVIDFATQCCNVTSEAHSFIAKKPLYTLSQILLLLLTQNVFNLEFRTGSIQT